MGDLNSRPKELGSHLITNANGVRWKAFLDTTDIAVFTGEHAPTHVQGGRLDYVALINMPIYTAKTLFVRSLLSDHFALETTLTVQSALAVPRKHLMVPPSRMAGLVVHVVACYSAMRGSFVDAEPQYNWLLHTIEGFIVTPRVLARAHAPRCWTYATKPVILNCQQKLAVYQRHWQLNPADTVTGCHGYRGLTPHGSVVAGKEEVLGFFPGLGAQDPVPPGGVAPRQQRLGQVQATGVWP
ncbi:hypothetical protein E2C01_067106 [Portunus trituberculatus]|uniref:Endonuclease/exonuclease/phosphatase domain-containing protein n=1 Tax=Portunus trituberculatus TaxID=210409 RepID=A0A5B7HRR7_PORTR|nr:hypothetical protein [Portunus trituberculatus]